MKKIYALKNGENTLNISVCSDKIIHLTYGKDPFKKKESVVIVPEIEALPQVDVTYEENENEYVIKTGYVTVTVEKATFDIRFFNKKGELMSRVSGNELVEYDVYRVVGGQTRTRETVDGQRETLDGGESQYVRKSNHGKLRLCFSENEELFGLGSHEEGYDSLKGHFVPLYQENMRIALPYLVSTKGYAYLFDCYSLATFDATNPRYGKMWFECLEYLDYYFIAGEGFDDICRSYRALTGVTPMLPKWAVGYVQSKERYKTQDELIEVAGEYRRIGVPLDCIVQDWCTWTRGNWGYKHLREDRYPDPKLLMDTLHGMNVHMLLSIWQNMRGETPDRLEFIAAGKMLADNSIYDAYDEEARKIYWRQTNEGLFQYGIDGWWCDGSEPYDAVWQGAERAPLPERMKQSVDEFKKYIDDSVINTYSLHHTRTIYEGQRGTTNEKRVINTRDRI